MRHGGRATAAASCAMEVGVQSGLKAQDALVGDDKEMENLEFA